MRGLDSECHNRLNVLVSAHVEALSQSALLLRSESGSDCENPEVLNMRNVNNEGARLRIKSPQLYQLSYGPKSSESLGTGGQYLNGSAGWRSESGSGQGLNEGAGAEKASRGEGGVTGGTVAEGGQGGKGSSGPACPSCGLPSLPAVRLPSGCWTCQGCGSVFRTRAAAPPPPPAAAPRPGRPRFWDCVRCGAQVFSPTRPKRCFGDRHGNRCPSKSFRVHRGQTPGGVLRRLDAERAGGAR